MDIKQIAERYHKDKNTQTKVTDNSKISRKAVINGEKTLSEKTELT